MKPVYCDYCETLVGFPNGSNNGLLSDRGCHKGRYAQRWPHLMDRRSRYTVLALALLLAVTAPADGSCRTRK